MWFPQPLTILAGSIIPLGAADGWRPNLVILPQLLTLLPSKHELSPALTLTWCVPVGSHEAPPASVSSPVTWAIQLLPLGAEDSTANQAQGRSPAAVPTASAVRYWDHLLTRCHSCRGSQSDCGLGVTHAGELRGPEKGSLRLWPSARGGCCVGATVSRGPDVAVGGEVGSVGSPWFHPAGPLSRRLEAGVSPGWRAAHSGRSWGYRVRVHCPQACWEEDQGQCQGLQAEAWALPSTKRCCFNDRQGQGASGRQPSHPTPGPLPPLA